VRYVRLHRHVGSKPGIATAVDNVSIGDQQNRRALVWLLRRSEVPKKDSTEDHAVSNRTADLEKRLDSLLFDFRSVTFQPQPEGAVDAIHLKAYGLARARLIA